jgi:hypothetical protein
LFKGFHLSWNGSKPLHTFFLNSNMNTAGSHCGCRNYYYYYLSSLLKRIKTCLNRNCIFITTFDISSFFFFFCSISSFIRKNLFLFICDFLKRLKQKDLCRLSKISNFPQHKPLKIIIHFIFGHYLESVQK